ncbi:MAG: acyl carrier protein [Bryobacteraceae bacterium]|jgi:acyl carrier protein
MQDAHFERLVSCFQTVFTNLNPGDIPAARHDNVAAWDSVAHVTLLSLVAEEFGMEIGFEEFESATSFRSILDLTRRKAIS